MALGNLTRAIGEASTAMGEGSRAEGLLSTAMGYVTQASGFNATAMGHVTKASGFISTSMGHFTEASGSYSTAMGSLTKATGQFSTVMGRESLASGDYSTAMGRGTEASGEASTAMGFQTKASGNFSTAMGNNSVASDLGAIASGVEAKATGQASVAMGVQTTASNAGAVALGGYTKASGGYSTAMGAGTAATGWQSTAMGTGTTAAGYSSTAMGMNSIAVGVNSVAMSGGKTYGDNTLVFGEGAEIGASTDRDTSQTGPSLSKNIVVLGNHSKATDSTLDNVYVLGSNVNATLSNSVYLGDGATSVASGNNLTTDNVEGTTTTGGATGVVSSAMVNGITYGGFAGSTSVGAVSVGASGAERRIQNVATGEISATSTDAINGSQLYSALQNISWNLKANGDIVTIKPGDTIELLAGDNMSISSPVTTPSSGVGTSTPVAGLSNQAVTLSSNGPKTQVAAGEGIRVTSNETSGLTTYTVSVKTDNKTVTVDADGSIAAVTGDIASSSTGVATATTPTALATAGGVATAINNAGFTLSTSADGGQKLSGSDEFIKNGKKVNITAGKNLTVKQESDGKVTLATADDLSVNTVSATQVNVGNTTITNSGMSIVNGPSITTAGIDAGGQRVTNVAAGVAPTDAVNVSQLNTGIGNLHSSINRVDKRASGGIASAMAMSALPQESLPGKTMIALAGSGYGGQAGYAAGISSVSDNGKWVVKGSISSSTAGRMGGAAGVGYRW